MSVISETIKRMKSVILEPFEVDLIKEENNLRLYPTSTKSLHLGIDNLYSILDRIKDANLPDEIQDRIKFILDFGWTDEIDSFSEQDDIVKWGKTDGSVIYPASFGALRMTKFAILNYLAKKNKIYVPDGIYPEEYYFIRTKNDTNNPDYEISHNGIVCYKIQAKNIGSNDELLDCPIIQLMNMTTGRSKHNATVIVNSSDAKQTASSYKNEQKEKERKTMFNGKFGKVRGNALALSYDGKIAVKNGNEDYVRYNAETSTVENIKDFVMNNNEFFFILPSAEVAEGDIIKYNDGFYQVTKVNEANIAAINLKNSTMATIVKETIFGMSFYAKVISLIDPNTFGKDNNGMMAMMMLGDDDNMDIKELMILQMMNGDKNKINPMMLALMMDDNDDDMLTNMLMMNMVAGGNAQFDMGNMMQNPMMLMMLMKDNGNCRGDNKFFKMMMLMNLMNQNKAETKDE